MDESKKITDLLQTRMNSRKEALHALEPNSLDQVPDQVKISRELQAAQLRAVIQEQNDLTEIIKMLFPAK